MNKTRSLMIGALVLMFGAGLAVAPVLATETLNTPQSVVSSIVLKAANTPGAINWVAYGKSIQGFKVVWSKNENPTYPLRDGDQYHYYDRADATYDNVAAFNGAGVYYVRVCEYLGGKCGKYSNQIAVQLGENVKPEPREIPKNSVTAINLTGEGNNVKWVSNGFSAQGYKVVWSKNDGPTYPIREGDRYHFRSNPEMNSDYLMPFAGAGVYYVRVCEYLGGACGVYSNQISVTLGNLEVKATQDIAKIQDSAKTLYDNKLDQLLAEIKSLRDLVKEQQAQINHLMRLKEGLAQTISSAMETAIKNFIAYGSDANTKKLGEGERAAVMYSFKDAFGKLPETQDEIEEAIKIANGRFPSIVSEEAEANAKTQFKKIYLRDADMSDAHDLAAIKVMAYGLRQKAENRNLKSESNALKTFKAIYKKLPQTTEEWNALQAITYSGATR